jgi:hypothetical protein
MAGEFTRRPSALGQFGKGEGTYTSSRSWEFHVNDCGVSRASDPGICGFQEWLLSCPLHRAGEVTPIVGLAGVSQHRSWSASFLGVQNSESETLPSVKDHLRPSTKLWLCTPFWDDKGISSVGVGVSSISFWKKSNTQTKENEWYEPPKAETTTTGRCLCCWL